MTRWSWTLVCSLILLGVACGPPKMTTTGGGSSGGLSTTGGGFIGSGGGTIGTGGGTTGTGGGTSGTGGGSTGGGTSATGGGSTGTGGGSTGTGGGSTVFDGGLMGGETCANAVALPGSSSLTSTTTGAMNDYLIAMATGCAESASTGSAPDVVYSVMVGNGQVLKASVTSTWDATINLIAAPDSNCGTPTGGATCVAGSDIVGNGTDTTSWVNTTGAPLNVFIVIDGYDMGEGDFALDVEVFTPPAGDTCEMPGMAMGMLPAETISNFTNNYSGAPGQCEFSSGPDRVYTVSIPTNQRLTVRATSGFNLSLSFIDDAAQCAMMPPVCAAGVNSAFSGAMQTEVLTIDNTNSTARTGLLVVDAVSSVMTGATFALDVSTGPIPPGDDCNNPVVVTPGATLSTEPIDGFRNDFPSFSGTNCEFLGGPDRVYSVTVPAGQRATASATGMSNIALSFIVNPAACLGSTTTCLRSADNVFGTAMPETLAYVNSTAASQTILLVVSNSSATMAGATFSLTVNVGPVPAGDSCATPIPLTPGDAGVTLTAQTITGFDDDYGSGTNTMTCAVSGGADWVYSATVPPNQRLTVTTTSLEDLALNVIADQAACTADPMVCADFVDDTLTGMMSMPVTETVGIDNTTTSPRPVLVMIDSFGRTGTYDLRASFGPIPPPPYTASMASGTCDSFAGVTPTVLLDANTTPPIDDDEVSDTAMLPFPFAFFGTAVTHFSVSTNGNLQLHTSATAFGDTEYSNEAIPTRGGLNGFVAPFWDDLTPTASSRIISNVFGTGSTRRLTVQWEMEVRNFDMMALPGAPIVVQARLFETTNVIELHACTLTASTDPMFAGRERGSQASVGIEALNGRQGYQHSFDMMNALTAGQIIRYTP